MDLRNPSATVTGGASGRRSRRPGFQHPVPQRLGRPEEYGDLATFIVEHDYLSGETIRLDGALRMAPR